MNSIFNFVEEIEKLAYKILLWIILIPKTLLQVILYPRWARLYVKQELRKDKESPFDEYISPVILLLVVTLLPALLINAIPEYGVKVVNPPPGTYTDSATITFDAQANFILNTQGPWHGFIWNVEKMKVAEDGSYQYEQGNEGRVYSTDSLAEEVHDESYSDSFLDRKMHFVGENSVEDHFQYTFDKAGGYLVNLTAGNFFIEGEERNVRFVESYAIDNLIFIYVPNKDDNIEYDPAIDGPINVSLLDFRQQTTGNQVLSTAEFFQNQNTILLALLLMIPPLFFAWVTQFHFGRPLGESVLKENFYIQCYYFAPVILSVWAVIIYYEVEVFQIILTEGFYDRMFTSWFLPIILMLVWFIGVETYVISRERDKTGKLFAFLITIACMFVIYQVWSIYETIITATINQRLEYGMRTYPAIVWLIILLFVAFRIRNFIKRRRTKQTADPVSAVK